MGFWARRQAEAVRRAAEAAGREVSLTEESAIDLEVLRLGSPCRLPWSFVAVAFGRRSQATRSHVEDLLEGELMPGTVVSIGGLGETRAVVDRGAPYLVYLMEPGAESRILAQDPPLRPFWKICSRVITLQGDRRTLYLDCMRPLLPSTLQKLAEALARQAGRLEAEAGGG